MNYFKLVCVFCCLFPFNTIYSQAIDTLYFDPATAGGGNAAKLVEEVNYIPLESTRAALFGTISQFITTKDYFIIRDDDTNALYFFDKAGKFIKKQSEKKYKISAIRYSAGENQLFAFYTAKNYNPLQKELFDDWQQASGLLNKKFLLKVYDLSSFRVSEQPFPYVVANPTPMGNHLFAASLIKSNPKWDNDTAYAIKILNDTKMVKGFLPYNQQADTLYNLPRLGTAQFSATGIDSALLCTVPFSYTIFILTPTRLTPLYTFVLPARNMLPPTFYHTWFKNTSARQDFEAANGDMVQQITNPIAWKNYLFFEFKKFSRRSDDRYIFDKTEKRFYNLKRISGDSTTSFLPVFSGAILDFDKNYLYTAISSATLFQTRDNNAFRNPKYSPVLTAYFEKSAKTSNPVLIQVKLKEGRQ